MTDADEVNEVKDVKEIKEKPARRGPVRNYTDLLVYRQAYRLILEVSRLTKLFPRAEQFEMGRQMRRASRSVAANIVEGWAKRVSSAEFKRHLVLAHGELMEMKFWLDLAADEHIADKNRCAELKVEYEKLGMLIHNLWKEWRKL